MRIGTLVLFGALSAALAGCADTGAVTAPEAGARDVTPGRSVYVDAGTYALSGGRYFQSFTSGGHVRGWATPVLGGTGYDMGDVEADWNSGVYFFEQWGYRGQLDAFPYSPDCSFAAGSSA